MLTKWRGTNTPQSESCIAKKIRKKTACGHSRIKHLYCKLSFILRLYLTVKRCQNAPNAQTSTGPHKFAIIFPSKNNLIHLFWESRASLKKFLNISWKTNALGAHFHLWCSCLNLIQIMSFTEILRDPVAVHTTQRASLVYGIVQTFILCITVKVCNALHQISFLKQ